MYKLQFDTLILYLWNVFEHVIPVTKRTILSGTCRIFNTQSALQFGFVINLFVVGRVYFKGFVFRFAFASFGVDPIFQKKVLYVFQVKELYIWVLMMYIYWPILVVFCYKGPNPFQNRIHCLHLIYKKEDSCCCKFYRECNK